MITVLAAKYQRHIAYVLFLLFSCTLTSANASGLPTRDDGRRGAVSYYYPSPRVRVKLDPVAPEVKKGASPIAKNTTVQSRSRRNGKKVSHAFIDGPNQPEMASFKSVGTNNMVNLFTGDFSYNIPLMDVGGYPVNIFYNGGLTMEQEASWVGLGWNINPGNVSRNMRGVPDDFNGDDQLMQVQKVKPNITWGFNMGADMEFVGIKSLQNFTGSAGVSLGLSFNNYLGPALDFGLKGGVGMKVAGKTLPEKNADTSFGLKLNAGFAANASSRYGFTFSPNLSLTAANFGNVKGLSNGVRLSTSYNSRVGIKQLQISDQMSYNIQAAKYSSEQNQSSSASSTSAISQSLLSSTINFAKPSYLPAIRMPLTNEAYSGHFQLGAGLFGGYVSGEVEAYQQKSYVDDNNVTLWKPMIGYLYWQNAASNPNALVDFSRLNENEVTPHTPIISAPQYAYDVFSIQGEGTGGTIRAYRNDYGYVRDNFTRSSDKNLSLGADIGPPGHYGANFNTIKTPSTIGEWSNGNKLRALKGFTTASGDTENVYFRNPGETSVLLPWQFDKIGGTDLVRFKLGGTPTTPSIEPTLERFTKSNQANGTSDYRLADTAARKKRTQVVSFLTAEEASKIGLDVAIKNYNNTTVLDASNNLQFTTIQRVSGYRRKHHISQINVTEADGKRYVYGIPVYNIRQKDFSFSVLRTEDPTDSGKVLIDAPEAGTSSPHLSSSSTTNRDGFLQITETPAYAHSFLLSGLLSPDYVDLTGNGITEDDLGNAVKFNYSQIAGIHKWRTPLTASPKANFHPGNLTETRDDKGLISYGERESWYLHSIESKTMIALFTLENRADGKGSVDTLQGIDGTDNTLKRLKKIDLYSKADLKKNGLTGARPIKTVWFAYSYSLCANTPDNTGSSELLKGINVNASKGKLTLDSIYVTYNGQNKLQFNKYRFAYTTTDPATNAVKGNPAYEFSAADRWGNYKPNRANPGGLRNNVYPYSMQRNNTAALDSINTNAGAWSLKKILLPSGGQIEVQYESDDYAYVQNRRATDMMAITGFSRGAGTRSNNLYSVINNTILDNDRVYISVPDACNDRTEVYQKYLQGLDQLAIKLAVRMPKGVEYITSYATIADYDVVSTDHNTIWVSLSTVDGMSPLCVSAIEYLREQLPGQAYTPAYDLSESTGLEKIAKLLVGMFGAFGEFLKDPATKLRQQSKAQSVVLNQSFIRLDDPDGVKYGGGHRVKSIRLKDNWQAMTGQYASEYGQEYDYSTVEDFNGTKRRISSGVASYEPSIGGEENPFQTMLQVANKLPLGPTSFGAIEMPVLDGFFPAPVVGYSKVTVRSLKRTYIPSDKKTRSGIGKQVTEFYTAKDFPVYYNQTSFDPASDMQDHKSSLLAFFYKYAFDSRALSQGFMVETNDMHGKVKSQSSYAENDTSTRINYTENFYRNTGGKGLNETFDFVYNAQGGVVAPGNMGIDVELMTDTREFSVKSSSLEVQGQVDLFPVIVPVWLPFVWPVAGNSENTYRAITCTKVINYHGVLDSVVVIDKGSRVATKNLVYDAETGDVVVSRTNNEFELPVYTVNYPAYWGYSGMGLAYKNIDAVFSKVDFLDGKITSGNVPSSVLESGDEVYLVNTGTSPVNCGAKLVSPSNIQRLWVFDTNKNTSSLTNTSPNYVFMDSVGKIYTRSGVSFRIVRSGKRNMLSASVASLSCMNNPVITSGTTRKLKVDSTQNVLAASALEYKEKWQTDPDVFNKYSASFNPSTCITTETLDCNGYLEKSINPYIKGLLGTFRTYRSMVFYGNRNDSNALVATNLKQNGFLKSFTTYWNFNGFNNLVPDSTNPKWVWNNQVTRVNAKGMELETKNALNVYSAALYGFNKTLPMAIANNSRYEEMMYEGFEGSGFNESLNGAVQNPCNYKQVNWSGIPNSSWFNADSAGTSAHTGKYVLSVNANSTAAKVIPLSTSNSGQFNLNFSTDTTKTLNQTGGNYSITPADGDPVYWAQSVATFGTTSVYVDVYPSYNQNFHRILTNWDTYIDIQTPGTYNYSLTLTSAYNTGGRQLQSYSNSMTVTIQDLSGNTFSNQTVGNYDLTTQYTSTNYSVYLCKGIYKISGGSSEYYQADPPSDSHNTYQWSCSNCGSNTYKSLSTVNGCVYTVPMAANTAMQNPGFALVAGKKMLFSAWVRDNGNAISNGAVTTSQVNLNFDNGTPLSVALKPEGPVIEGWQRVEGSFTPPANATQLTVNLVNNTGGAIYFDDIRLHPFNANMKSYAYDPVNLRLTAEMDANNYATFYEYDEEGGLVRTKVETKEGVKTIKETRSFQQRNITKIQ